MECNNKVNKVNAYKEGDVVQFCNDVECVVSAFYLKKFRKNDYYKIVESLENEYCIKNLKNSSEGFLVISKNELEKNTVKMDGVIVGKLDPQVEIKMSGITAPNLFPDKKQQKSINTELETILKNTDFVEFTGITVDGKMISIKLK